MGLQPGDVTGNWDMSHLMQLAYGDLLKKSKSGKKSATYNTFFANLVQEIFDLMSDFNSGKAALRFHEFAENLYYSVLSNKSNQTTRFVRSLLRGVQSLLRNLACLYGIYGEVAVEKADEKDNTAAN